MDQRFPSLYTTTAPNHLHILIHPNPGASRLLLDLAASLALRGPLTVLDGGNCFNIYTVAQALRRGGADVRQALGRIHVARAFTCYQMAALVCQAPEPPAESAATAPLMVLDFLNTFLDENVSLGERKRLLRSTLPALRQRCLTAPILISIRKEVPELMEILLEASDVLSGNDIWRAEAPPPPPVQITLGIEF
jgi:hypothetical protein